MAIDFGSVADDFFVNCNLQTTLEFPTSRETVLHFCEAVQKEFPEMTSFYQRDGGEYVLEGDRDSGAYQWLELHPRRFCAGFFNPPGTARAQRMHEWLLDRSVYYLGVSGLDVDALDVTFGFNLDYQGNRDAIVAQALLAGSPLSALCGEGAGRAIEFEPNMVVSVDEDCYMQARLSLETHGNSYQVRTGRYELEPISIYFTVRRYPSLGKVMNINEAFAHQMNVCEDLVARVIVPQIIQPIASAIATQ